MKYQEDFTFYDLNIIHNALDEYYENQQNGESYDKHYKEEIKLIERKLALLIQSEGSSMIDNYKLIRVSGDYVE